MQSMVGNSGLGACLAQGHFDMSVEEAGIEPKILESTYHIWPHVTW